MELTGRTISHYKVEEEISRGGMGVVYRATDTRLHRDVALKVLPEDLTNDEDRRRRFVQEAQAASAIEHPNVAVIYDADEADGQTFIAMELIRGEKMSDWLARQRPSVAQALDLASEIAAGLAKAHEKQIVHRDLKPANVMITDDGHAKIIDFGIAKLIETATTANDETRVNPDTAAGMLLGTMTYMSPEQARGDKVDHRSDIFSFGILLHEMLSGKPPFQGKTSVETAAAILHQAAPRLPALGQGAAPEVGADLQRIIDKCLAKDPVDRYQGMKDVGVDLRAARRRLESGTHPVTAVSSAPPRRKMTAVAVLGGSVLVVALAVGVVFWRGRSTPGPLGAKDAAKKPSVAVLYFDNSTGAADLEWLRTGITEMVVTDLSQSQDFEVVGTDRLYSALASLKRADDKTLSPEVISQLVDRIGVDHLVLGSYMKAGDSVRINLRLQEAKSGRIVTSERVDGPNTSSLFQMVDDLSHRIRTKFEELRPGGARGGVAILSAPGAATGKTEGLDRGLGDVTTTSIDAYRQYAEGVNMHERFREAEAAAFFEKAIAVDPSFAMAYVKLAVAQNNLGHIDLRDKYAALALQHSDRLTPRERYYIEGFYYSQRADSIGRGMDAYKKCVEMDPGHEACRHNLALGLMNLERFEEAAGHYEELITRGVTNPTAFSNLASAYLQLGMTDKAIAVTETFSKRNPENGGGHRGLAVAMLGQGRYEDALQELSRAEILDPTDGTVPLYRGMAQLQREDWTAARATAAALSSSPDQTRRWYGGIVQTALEGYAGRCAESLAANERMASAYKVPGVRTGVAREATATLQIACGQVRGRTGVGPEGRGADQG